MKKAIIFSIAMILNGAVFASGLEGFKSQSSLTALNTKTLNGVDVIMPEKAKKINITIIKGRKKQLKYFLVNINGKAVCADKSGKRGYNKMTANELQSLPQTAECAYLSRADLEWANLTEANFAGAYLRGANLRWAYLRSANLRKAYMRGTNFSGAYLTRADLRGNLNGADLSGADLRWANLSGADLSDADFNGANLRGANLEGA
ncbi:MAG: pentapeptide repeat-containing protein, partial [Elusimicrobiales bacterium]|nr:pentapeptide repeat-containing protein [Elusimicrobiales bacterium]